MLIAIEGVIIPAFKAALPRLFVMRVNSLGGVSKGADIIFVASARSCLFLVQTEDHHRTTPIKHS